MPDLIHGPLITGPRIAPDDHAGTTVELDPPDQTDPTRTSTLDIAAVILSGQSHLTDCMFPNGFDSPAVLTARTRQKVRACRMLAAELVRQEREDAVGVPLGGVQVNGVDETE